jgi:hypothetical protein
MQYRLLPADRAERAVVPDVLRRRRPLQCSHDCLTPVRRDRCGNSALLFGRDFVPAARVSQQQLFKNATFSRAERRAPGNQTALLSLSSVVPHNGKNDDESVHPDMPPANPARLAIPRYGTSADPPRHHRLRSTLCACIERPHARLARIVSSAALNKSIWDLVDILRSSCWGR